MKASQKNIYCVDGEETWQIKEKVQSIIAQYLNSDQKSLGLEKIEDEISFEKVSTILQTPVFWTPYRVLLLWNPDFVQKTVPASWLSLFQTIELPYVLIVALEGKLDGRRPLNKWLMSHGQYSHFSKIQEWEMEKLLEYIARLWENYDYQPELPHYFLEKIGSQPSLLRSESEKLKV